MVHKQRLVVVGGGAAGFFCAVNAAEMNPAIEVILLEKSAKFLSKVAISGGGRCNVTQACSSMTEMLKAYPRGSRLLKKAFYQFFTNDIAEWFAKRGVALKTEADGRMFPLSNSSETIVRCLLQQASEKKIKLRPQTALNKIYRQQEQFILELSTGEKLTADFVCVSCGGFPKISQYEIFKELDIAIVPPVPSLFTFNLPHHPIRELMGISVTEAEARLNGTKLKTTGPLLITHWGLSGPAVLKLSALAAREMAEKNYQFNVLINWVPEWPEEKLQAYFSEHRQQHGATRIMGKNPFGLPARLWQFLAAASGVEDAVNWADLPSKKQNKFIKNLCSYEVEVSGKTTFKEEFVTAGGIALEEIDPQTMMCKKHPGLFFAGEILDVDGITGGYNFQNAWTTGFIAAKHIATAQNGQ